MKSSPSNFADEVTKSPEGHLRLALLEAAMARQFDDAEYDKYLGELATVDPDPALAAEIIRVKNTDYSQTPEISLDTSGRQLLWAATLLHHASTAAHDKIRFSDTPFFRHLISQPVFQQELLRYAHTLSDHFDRNKTRIRWGAPLSWFYFSPSEKIINLDPFHSLVFGMPRYPQDFAHSRGPAYHEVGHAILSAVLPESFQHAMDRLQELGKKKQPLTPAEEEEVVDTRIDAMLWGQFYNLAEDNVVNRFAIILGRYRHSQNYDYAESLKYVYALINQSRKSFEDFKADQWSGYVKAGRSFLDKMKASGAIEQFNSISKILGMTVPVNEGLFGNDKSQWQKSGVNWAAFMPSQDDAGKIQSAAILLAEGDGKPDSISYQQPYMYRVMQTARSGGIAAGIAKASERFFRYLTTDSATIHSREEIEQANQARNVVIEHLWQKYVLPILPQIRAEIKQQLQQAQQSMQQGMANQIPGPPASGMGAPGNSQQPNQRQGGEGKPESNKGENKPDSKGEPGKDGTEGAPDKGNQADKSDKKDKSEQEGAEGKSPAESDEKEEGGTKADQPQDAADSNGGSVKPKPVELGNEDQSGDENKIGYEETSNPGQFIQEIIQEGEQQESTASERQQRQEGQLQNVVRQAQELTQEIKYDFPEGDWSNYQVAKQRLMWLSNICVRQLDDIRKRQVERQVRRGRQLEMLPDGGEIDRLDMDAQFRLVTRVGAQAPLRPDDFKRFAGNKTAIKLTTPQIVLLIDGSASMKRRMNGTQGAPPIDIAISTGLALYEATNQINARVTDPRPAFECYSGIWGPNNPTWLTWPGLEATEAGKNFDRFRGGLQTNTNLAPALGMVSEKLCDKNSTAENIGATHLLILSDGDIQDSAKTVAQVIKLIENVKNLTIDIVLISAQDDPEIVKVFRRLKGQYPNLNYGVHCLDDIDQLPLTCLRALRQRMTQEIVSTPAARKAAEFKRAVPG